MPELLLELTVEEIPAAAQAPLAEQLANFLVKKLEEAHIKIDTDSVSSFHTPRRLIVRIEDLPTQIPESTESRKGPSENAPEQAIAGFLKANNITLKDCELLLTPSAKNANAKSWFLTTRKPATDLSKMLPLWINEAIVNLKPPKSMRAKPGHFRFIRPLRSIMAIFDGVGLSGFFEFDDTKITFTDSTVGHYMLNPIKITPKDFEDYQLKLRDAQVIIDASERKDMIEKERKDMIAKERKALKDKILGKDIPVAFDTIIPIDIAPYHENLLEEILNLTEYPVFLQGNFDEKFLKLPFNLLDSVFYYHQKYFLLVDENDTPYNRFAFIANGDRGVEANQSIIKGNERVLNARLEDALFFATKDLATDWNDWLALLERQVFHQKLGMMSVRISHLGKLAEYLCQFTKADSKLTARAARICKADLASLAVQEFPHLQGAIGAYYSEKKGEKPEIVDAIKQHYDRSSHDGSAYLTAPTSATLALADRMLLLVGFFAIDERPTGSKDPFGLRRAAIGITTLLWINRKNFRIHLRPFIEKAFDLWGKNLDNKKEICESVLDFIIERQRAYLKQSTRYTPYNLIDVIRTRRCPNNQKPDELTTPQEQAKTLKEFIEKNDNGKDLLATVKRVHNLIRSEEKKRKTSFPPYPEIDEKLLKEDAEIKLYESLKNLKAHLENAGKSFDGKLHAIATMRPIIDDFFDNVTINHKQQTLADNRLNLLISFHNHVSELANFSLIQEQTTSIIKGMATK